MALSNGDDTSGRFHSAEDSPPSRGGLDYDRGGRGLGWWDGECQHLFFLLFIFVHFNDGYIRRKKYGVIDKSFKFRSMCTDQCQNCGDVVKCRQLNPSLWRSPLIPPPSEAITNPPRLSIHHTHFEHTHTHTQRDEPYINLISYLDQPVCREAALYKIVANPARHLSSLNSLLHSPTLSNYLASSPLPPLAA